jgi:hypothetical protein
VKTGWVSLFQGTQDDQFATGGTWMAKVLRSIRGMAESSARRVVGCL